MKKYLIERNIPGAGQLDREALSAAATRSNAVLAQLAPRIQWRESYVTQDKLFCIYLADDEAVIAEHARLSGFPANRITEVGRVIDPATAGRRSTLQTG